MQITNLRLFLICITLGFIQIIINNTTDAYIDSIGALIIILLFNENYSIKTLIIMSLFADLIGAWYLGSHLFAAVMVSFLIKPLMNFYNMCASLQKMVIIILMYAILFLILIILGLVYNNWVFNLKGYLLDSFVIVPIAFIVANLLKSPKVSLFND